MLLPHTDSQALARSRPRRTASLHKDSYLSFHSVPSSVSSASQLHTPSSMAEQYSAPNTTSEDASAGLTTGGDNAEKKTTKNPWQWFLEKPLSRWPFLLFLVCFGLTFLFIILYYSSPQMGFIIAGVSVIVLCIYAWNHFRTLVALKEQVYPHLCDWTAVLCVLVCVYDLCTLWTTRDIEDIASSHISQCNVRLAVSLCVCFFPFLSVCRCLSFFRSSLYCICVCVGITLRVMQCQSCISIGWYVILTTPTHTQTGG